MVKKRLPLPVAPHSQVQVELLDSEAAAVAGVGPRIGGPTGAAPLSTEPIGDRVAPRKHGI